MAKRNCTRREKAEEIADCLFMAEDTTWGAWSKTAFTNWLARFLRPWQPTRATRKKTKARKT